MAPAPTLVALPAEPATSRHSIYASSSSGGVWLLKRLVKQPLLATGRRTPLSSGDFRLRLQPQGAGQRSGCSSISPAMMTGPEGGDPSALLRPGSAEVPGCVEGSDTVSPSMTVPS